MGIWIARGGYEAAGTSSYHRHGPIFITQSVQAHTGPFLHQLPPSKAQLRSPKAITGLKDRPKLYTGFFKKA